MDEKEDQIPLKTFDELIASDLMQNQSEPEIRETKQQKKEMLTEEEKERKISEELIGLLSELSSLKEEGNIQFKATNYLQAEGLYAKAIEKISTYVPSETLTNEVPQIIGLLKEMHGLFIMLLGNSSMSLAKQHKYKQAIEKTLNIIELDPMHEKSYSRLLQWYIENNEIEKANYAAKDIKSKFSNNLGNFKENLDILDGINKKLESQINQKKGYKEKGWVPWLAGAAALIASGLLVTLLIKKQKGLI